MQTIYLRLLAQFTLPEAKMDLPQRAKPKWTYHKERRARNEAKLDSVTNEAKKTCTGRWGWLGQSGRHGHFQGQEEGPSRGSSWLAYEVTDMRNHAGLVQQEMTVSASFFDGEVEA